MWRRSGWFSIPLLLLLASGCIMVPFGGQQALELEEVEVLDAPGIVSDKILVLELEGVISTHSEESLLSFSESSVSLLRDKLKMAAADDDVVGIVLRIDSPGGGVTASDILNEELRTFREETKKPIVACCMDTAASGAYYVAVACDRILAHPTSVIGSIGVIMQLWNLQGLMDKVGVRIETIKSGEKKDMGNYARELSDEERKLFQSLIDTLHSRFLDVILRGRPDLKRSELKKLADGRVFLAEEAVQHGLVDKIGYIGDAVEEVKSLASVPTANLVIYRRPGAVKTNIYSTGGESVPRMGGKAADLIPTPNLKPGFYYLWAPTGQGR